MFRWLRLASGLLLLYLKLCKASLALINENMFKGFDPKISSIYPYLPCIDPTSYLLTQERSITSDSSLDASEKCDSFHFQDGVIGSY